MNIRIQSVHFKASKQLEDFINDKVAKLSHQKAEIIRADVTLYEGASGNPQNQFCEIQLSVRGNNHFVKKNTGNYEQSILEAVEALQKVLRRSKTKKLPEEKYMHKYKRICQV